MANISKSVKLGVFTLAIMNVTAVVFPSRATCRSRIWTEFGILLSFCSHRLPDTDFIGSSRIGSNVSGQARRCIPLGW